MPSDQARTDMPAAGLNALFVNCSLKRDASESHTGRLMGVSARIMEKAGAQVDHLHMLDHRVPPGVFPDMTEQGWDRDDWPDLWPRFLRADILVIGTPIWLGEESSVCRLLIERLYAMSGQTNERGQSIFYGRAGGNVVTGNEDGVKHVSMSLAFALSHLGYVVPPQASTGWIGEAGPGPSYGDELEDGTRVGLDNDFTAQTTTVMSWNLIHLARMLKQAGGLPRQGNDRNAWSDGARFGYAPPG